MAEATPAAIERSTAELDAIAIAYWGAATFDPTRGSPPVSWARLSEGERAEALRKHAKSDDASKANADPVVHLSLLTRVVGAIGEDLRRLLDQQWKDQCKSEREYVDGQCNEAKADSFRYIESLASLLEDELVQFRRRLDGHKGTLDDFEKRLKALEERK